MEKIKHQFRGPNTGVINHFKKHKQNYLFGMLGGFAIVKTFLFLFSFFGVINISGTFAQRGLELSSGNIQDYCPDIGTDSCDLSSNGIVSIAPDTFNGYTNLQSLYLSENQLTEINLSGLDNLSYLELSNNQLTGINLSGLNSLKSLNLRENQLTGIDLSFVPNLKDLYLHSNQLTEIDLNGLDNLSYLELYNNQLTEIDLDGLSNLQWLDLYNNQLTEIDLDGLDNLTDLRLGDNQLTEIDLNGLDNLSYLELSSNQLTEIDLDGLDNLTDLRLGDNQLTEIDLSGLNNLTELFLYNNQLTEIDLSGLNNLTELFLYNNQLTEIDLDGLSNLQWLELSNNQLTEIDLDGLSNLTYLYLDRNQLTEIDLSPVPNLTYLYLDRNQLTEIDLSPVPNLKDLYLDSNQLTEIDLDGLSNLQSLNLSYNKLYNLPDSDALYNVTNGYINHNYLDVESIENDSDLVDMLDQKFNEDYGWRIQYLPMELSLSGNIVSVSDNMFTIDLEYHNSGSRSSFDSAIYYDMVNGVDISTDTPYTTGYVGQTWGGFGDPCFDELYDSGTGAYVELLNNLSQAMEGMDALPYIRYALGYTGTAEDAGKFIINRVIQGFSDNFFNMFSWNDLAGMLGIDLSSAPNCGTGGRNAYIFDLGNILSGNGGVISITGIYNGGYTGFENKIELLSTNKLSINVGTGDTNIALFYSGGNNETTPVVSNGGGGGGHGLHKDVCPQNRDCSDSYYDGICGPCSLEERENQKQHGSADTQYLFQNKELFAQEVARVKSSTSSKYSNELFEAYVFAKDLGITTMPTIDEAKLGDKLLRSHMAKMISNYAVKILRKPIDTQKKCEFTDMTDETQEMKNYAKLACQLGLMGIHNDGTANTVFNPEGELTRAEFGTVMSRLLRGDKYNGGKIYYKAHLNALKKEGIMTKIENPAMKELRGRVMLMLMRSFEK